MKKPRYGKVHAIIPDCQVRPDMNTDYLIWIGNYIADKQPDRVICIGDFGDMPSINSHAKLKELEGKRYQKDTEAVRNAMDKLLKPIRAVKGYNPQLILTLGNHEARINTEVKNNPKFEGVISIDDLGYEARGWKVVPFLKPITVDGISYCHYFISGTLGKPVSSASALLKRVQGSAVQGHVQHFDLAVHPYTGRFGMFCGTCNLVNEEYLTPQGNNYRRQIIFLHEVHNGIADPMLVSLRFLKLRYS